MSAKLAVAGPEGFVSKPVGHGHIPDDSLENRGHALTTGLLKAGHRRRLQGLRGLTPIYM